MFFPILRFFSSHRCIQQSVGSNIDVLHRFLFVSLAFENKTVVSSGQFAVKDIIMEKGGICFCHALCGELIVNLHLYRVEAVANVSERFFINTFTNFAVNGKGVVCFEQVVHKVV